MSTKGIFQRLLGHARYRPSQAGPRSTSTAHAKAGPRDPGCEGHRATRAAGSAPRGSPSVGWSQHSSFTERTHRQRGVSTTWDGQRLSVGTGVQVTPL